MKTVVVVEDNELNMSLVTDVLEAHGYRVLPFNDAGRALTEVGRAAPDLMPDLILMDIHLPGVDGVEATRRLKRDARTRDIPVVALTARAMAGDREALLAAGCDDYLAKPVRYKELLSLVERLTAPAR